MKRFILLIVLSFSLFSCKAQTKIDPISLASREKSDIILKSFDAENASEILVYSLEDKDFYVVLKNDNGYTEYYASLNIDAVVNKRMLKTKKKDEQLLSDAFKLDKYHSEFIIKMPDAKYVRGKKSYFVVKDSSGKRYGEYSLAALTLPLPIDGSLAGYLMRRLGEEIPQ